MPFAGLVNCTFCICVVLQVPGVFECVVKTTANEISTGDPVPQKSGSVNEPLNVPWSGLAASAVFGATAKAMSATLHRAARIERRIEASLMGFPHRLRANAAH